MAKATGYTPIAITPNKKDITRHIIKDIQKRARN